MVALLVIANASKFFWDSIIPMLTYVQASYCARSSKSELSAINENIIGCREGFLLAIYFYLRICIWYVFLILFPGGEAVSTSNICALRRICLFEIFATSYLSKLVTFIHGVNCLLIKLSSCNPCF